THLLCRHRHELLVRERRLRRSCANAARELVEPLEVRARRPLPRGAQDNRREVRIVAGTRHVQRDSEERRLDDLVLLERPRQLLLAEPGQARPQRDVRRLRPLGLDRAEPLEGVLDAELAPLEEKLTSKERAIQLPERELALSHSSRPKNEAEIA